MPPEAKSPLKQAKNRLHNFFINLSEKLHEKLKIPQVAKDYNCFSVEIRKFWMVPKHSDQMTTVKKQREIVIEYERIQLIRKRARTEITHCPDCGGEADFVSIKDAAELFGTGNGNLFHFIQINQCHYRADADTNIQLCLTSLLACMKTKTLNKQIKMLGD